MQSPTPPSVSSPAPRTTALARRRAARSTTGVVARRRAVAVRADRVLAAGERVPRRHHRRLLEFNRLLFAYGRDHERLPDRRREGRPGNGDAVHVQHRYLTPRVADPDGRLELRGVPAEPSVRVVV